MNIDDGALRMVGTNKRVGLLGTLSAEPGGKLRLRGQEFDLKQVTLRFDDPTRIYPYADAVATTEYRRHPSVALYGGAVMGSLHGAFWRIRAHARGGIDDLRLSLSSEPPLSQGDIVLLLTVGVTRLELDQMQALRGGIALEAISTFAGTDRAVKEIIPVDDFRFGSAYSPRAGRMVPQIIVGKRIGENTSTSLQTGLAENRELRSMIEYRLSQKLAVEGSYDNVTRFVNLPVGNIGLGFRWRLEFE
jgi:translocation and assembly module TamB